MYFCLNSISMKYTISAILIVLLSSCMSTDNQDNITCFGGEIINPKASFVLLLKDDKVIDTLKLNRNNQFLESFPDVKEGLYTFKHGPEFQYMYLQPKDSLLVRLNTWDFDESMVFSVAQVLRFECQ